MDTFYTFRVITSGKNRLIRIKSYMQFICIGHRLGRLVHNTQKLCSNNNGFIEDFVWRNSVLEHMLTPPPLSFLKSPACTAILTTDMTNVYNTGVNRCCEVQIDWRIKISQNKPRTKIYDIQMGWLACTSHSWFGMALHQVAFEDAF